MQLFKAIAHFCLFTAALNSAQAEITYNKKVNPDILGDSDLKKSVAKNQASVDKGWGFLTAKLRKDGIKDWEISAVYDNKKMPAMGIVYFSLNPKEAHSMYAGFYKQKLIDKARDFLISNQSVFIAAERKYKVSRNVIAAILLVETKFGEHTGDSLVINRLSRVGGIAKPSNIQAVYKKLKKDDPDLTYEEVEARALHLEERFYPEIIALFQMARKYKVNLLELRGSPAGAFGMPQFLPSTFMNHSADGDGDGKISLFNRADAIHSTARYLSNSGWQDSLSRQSKEDVIWKYNHSHAYIDTVLAIADILAK